MLAKTRHLVQRSSGFYARLAVPESLRQVVGKRELWAPLTAATRADALRKLPGAVARMQATLEAARAATKSEAVAAAPPRHGKPLTIRQMAVVHYQDQLRFDDEARNTDHRFAAGFIDEQYVAALQRATAGSASNEELQTTVGWIIHKFQANGNTKAVPETPEWRELARAMAAIELEGLKRTAERDEGDFTGKPEHPLLTQDDAPPAKTDATTARILSPESTSSLSDLLPMFVGERGAKGPANREYDVTIRMFEEALGEARPIFKITRQDVHAFKRTLSEAPSNYTKRFPDKTLPDAIKANKARATPFPALNVKTVNDKYLSKLHSILGWCVRNDIIPDNPAAGIKVDTIKDSGKPPRVPFTPDDLTRIFGPVLFPPGVLFGEPQWATFISLFTGMRPSELAQLQLDSIRHERGTLVFAIEEETKTSGSQRLVPVSSKLLALGFDQRVTALRTKGETHLFPEWYRKGMDAKRRAGRDGKTTLNHYFPRYIPKRFNDSLLPKIGIHDPRKSFYSFRHTFKTGLSFAGVERSIRDYLCGHQDYSAGAAYVHEVSIEAMKDAIEKLKFDGFNH